MSLAVVTLCVLPLSALASDSPAKGENTPLHLGNGSVKSTHLGGGSTGGTLVRTLIGLVVVVGVIYGVAWVLKHVRHGRGERGPGRTLASVASIPLGSNRSLHLVRAGNELVLVGVAEHGVTPIRTYAEDEARAAGLIDASGTLEVPEGEESVGGLSAPGRLAGGARLVDRVRQLTVRK